MDLCMNLYYVIMITHCVNKDLHQRVKAVAGRLSEANVLQNVDITASGTVSKTGSLQLPGGGGLASLNSLILMDNPSDELIQQRLMVSSESFKAMGIAMDTPSEQDRISQAIGADLGAVLALTSLSPNNSLGLMSDAGDPASAGQGN